MFSPFDWKKSELVFTVCVVTFIVAISYWQVRLGQMKTRDAQRKSDVELVAKGLIGYFADHKIYPPASVDGKIISCGTKGGYPCEWGKEDRIMDADEVVYLSKIPTDPFEFRGWKYVYVSDEKRQNFKIYIALEVGNDVGRREGLTVECGSNVQCSWYASN